jgi:hypothetical protein
MRHTAVHERERKIRIDPYCFRVVVNGAFGILAKLVGIAAIVICECQTRIAGDSLGE